MVSGIRLDVVEHAVEVAGLKAIDLHDDACFVLVLGSEDIALLSDEKRGFEPFDVALGDELVDGAIREVIKHIMAHLLVFLESLSASSHGG